MKKKLFAQVIGMAILVLTGSIERAGACTCAGEPPPCQDFSRATAVFVGQVLDAAQQRESKEDDGTVTIYDVGSIRFQITEAFAGVKDGIVVIESGTGDHDCGYWFKREETYLVYAFGDFGDLSTSICTRTRPIAEAAEDLAFLRNLPKRGSGGLLYGIVLRHVGSLEHGPTEATPLRGIKVTAEGPGARQEVLTDDLGQYRISGLAPGDYDVRIELPTNLGFTSTGDRADRFGSYSGHEKTRVYDRGCTENNFAVQSSGSISGIMTDAEGRPVNKMKVDLVDADDAQKSWSAWTDANGNYEFRMVQPGSYRLGINLDGVPDSDYPYPRMLYPGVSEEGKAKIVVVGDGEELQGFDLVLPPKLVERKVAGVVTWPDGRPAACTIPPAAGTIVFVELRDARGKSRLRAITVDADGSFSLSLFDGGAFVIFADADTGNSSYVHSEPRELIPGEKTGSLRLTLSQSGSAFESRSSKKKQQMRNDSQ